MALIEDGWIPKPVASFPRNLEPLSVDVLQHYLVELDEERARTQQELARKQRAADAAARVFRS